MKYSQTCPLKDGMRCEDRCALVQPDGMCSILALAYNVERIADVVESLRAEDRTDGRAE